MNTETPLHTFGCPDAEQRAARGEQLLISGEPCARCAAAMEEAEIEAEDAAERELFDGHPAEYDNGPTGHGPDLCWSDADPGL